MALNCRGGPQLLPSPLPCLHQHVHSANKPMYTLHASDNINPKCKAAIRGCLHRGWAPNYWALCVINLSGDCGPYLDLLCASWKGAPGMSAAHKARIAGCKRHPQLLLQ